MRFSSGQHLAEMASLDRFLMTAFMSKSCIMLSMCDMTQVLTGRDAHRWSAWVAFNNHFWRSQNWLERDFLERKNGAWRWCERWQCSQSEQHRSGQTLPCDLERCRDAFRCVLVAGVAAIQNFCRLDVLRKRTAGNGQDQHRHKPEHGSGQVGMRVCPVRHRRKYTRESHENQAERGSSTR
jgi:hypothetical protein